MGGWVGIVPLRLSSLKNDLVNLSSPPPTCTRDVGSSPRRIRRIAVGQSNDEH
jgi:hypothetical protein